MTLASRGHCFCQALKKLLKIIPRFHSAPWRAKKATVPYAAVLTFWFVDQSELAGRS